MEGKITKVLSEKKFFFVDNDYFCHFDKYDNIPEVGDIVKYERTERGGKKNANNVEFIMKPQSPVIEYLKYLNMGYFDESSDKNCLKEDLIIKYPKLLAEFFQRGDKNKPAQLAKFYYNIKHIETIHKIKKDFHETKSELLKISPLATKAKERNHISKEFEDFLTKNIELASKSEENFIKGFVPHFQCLMGYYKAN